MKCKRISTFSITLALILVLAGCGGADRLVWPDTSLGNRLPGPPVKTGEITVETSDVLMVDAFDATEKDYQRFVESCEKKGFTIDSSKEDYAFSAYDEDGYFLELRYWKDDKKINITVRASVEVNFGEFSWPKSKIASSVPVPESNFGTISWESENGFVIYVGETSKEDYAEYVDQCYDAGFTIDYSKGDDYFRGVNEDGYHLNVNYEGNQTMFVRVDTSEALGKEPPEKTAPPSEEPSVPADTTPEPTEPIDTSPAQTEPPASSATPEEPTSVSYSTNDYETAKNGNSGVFSYVNRGPSYDIYWIIDFDEGYVYYFTDGNGDEGCDKVKMESGDLNDVLIITYHDGGDTWSYSLHFHYKNQPSKLIMQGDHSPALQQRDRRGVRSDKGSPQGLFPFPQKTHLLL